jgi:hypothetical protein
MVLQVVRGWSTAESHQIALQLLEMFLGTVASLLSAERNCEPQSLMQQGFGIDSMGLTWRDYYHIDQNQQINICTNV